MTNTMEFEQVASFDNYMLANMTLGLLQENDINCHLKDEHIVTIDPLLNPAVGGIKLMVEKTDAAAALVLMHEAEENYLKEIPCPNCKAHALGIEQITQQPVGFWQKLKNQVLYGQEAPSSKHYRCGNCKQKFDELPMSF